ncbi:MAG: metalloregulator ArsR/SmtB family transcription factor [Actinomycetota bacterium]|nr:metalloregulator ArsR/SmtB family transcription factor [Actinomycetota bacterium]
MNAPGTAATDDADPAGGHWRQLPPDERIDAATQSLRMLADPTRLRMLWLLCGRDYDVTSLAVAVGIARPAVSQHLAKLRLAGLVRTHRDGRRVISRAADGHVRRMLAEALQAAHHHIDGLPDHD